MRCSRHVDLLRASALNEQELWREMVRWSGGRIVEERRRPARQRARAPICGSRSAPIRGSTQRTVVARATEFFAAEPAGFIVLVRRPDDEDIERAALAAGFRAGLDRAADGARRAPPLSRATCPTTSRCASSRTTAAVVDYGRVVALANDDPGERERAPLLFHDETILAPHIAAFVAYLGAEPVACAMTLLSHRIAGVFYVATVERACWRGRGHALTRMAARAGFEMGAGAVWLGASDTGAGLYRRIGFEDLGSAVVEFESPAAI